MSQKIENATNNVIKTLEKIDSFILKIGVKIL